MDAMQTLRELGMNVFDGSDIEFFLEYQITLRMLMGDEPIPEETLKKIREDFNDQSK
jgi:hypothetical protein